MKIKWKNEQIELKKTELKLSDKIKIKVSLFEFPGKKPPESCISSLLENEVDGKVSLISVGWDGNIKEAIKNVEYSLEQIYLNKYKNENNLNYDSWNSIINDEFSKLGLRGEKISQMSCEKYIKIGEESRLNNTNEIDKNVKKILNQEKMNNGYEKTEYLDFKNKVKYKLEIIWSAIMPGNDSGRWMREAWIFNKDFNSKSADNFLKQFRKDYQNKEENKIKTSR